MISTPRARRTVRETLASYGSHCSAECPGRIRLCPIHEGPPLAGCPRLRAEQRTPFAPAPLQRLPRYYGLLRPWTAHRYARSRRGHLLDASPFASPPRFSRSMHKPGSGSRHLHAGCRLGRNRNASQPYPGKETSPRFRHHHYAFDTSSVVCLHSPSRAILDGSSPPFPQRSAPRLLTVAPCGSLQPASDRRLRGACPHLMHSIEPPFMGSFVTHRLRVNQLPRQSNV